jgi:hypothetical protein
MAMVLLTGLVILLPQSLITCTPSAMHAFFACLAFIASSPPACFAAFTAFGLLASLRLRRSTRSKKSKPEAMKQALLFFATYLVFRRSLNTKYTPKYTPKY